MSLEFQFSDDLYFAIKGAYSVNILITKSGFYCEFSTIFFSKNHQKSVENVGEILLAHARAVPRF